MCFGDCVFYFVYVDGFTLAIWVHSQMYIGMGSSRCMETHGPQIHIGIWFVHSNEYMGMGQNPGT